MHGVNDKFGADITSMGDHGPVSLYKPFSYL